MPEKNLDIKKREGYKKALLRIKDDTLHDIKNMISVNDSNSAGVSAESSGHAQHMADVATDMYDREFNLGLASNDRELLNKVEAALKRIEGNEYGNCSLCKKAIPAVRLKAIPYVETCLKCQEELEKKM
jgi:DnaK suppressor protein